MSPFLLTQELLYTAVSRPQQLLIIISTEKALKMCVETPATPYRQGLADMLRAEAEIRGLMGLADREFVVDVGGGVGAGQVGANGQKQQRKQEEGEKEEKVQQQEEHKQQEQQQKQQHEADEGVPSGKKDGRKKSAVRKRTKDVTAGPGLASGAGASAVAEEDLGAEMAMTRGDDGADQAERGAGQADCLLKKSNKESLDESQQGEEGASSRTKAGRNKSTARKRTGDGTAEADLGAVLGGASAAAEAGVEAETLIKGADSAEGGAGQGKRGSKKSQKSRDESQRQDKGASSGTDAGKKSERQRRDKGGTAAADVASGLAGVSAAADEEVVVEVLARGANGAKEEVGQGKRGSRRSKVESQQHEEGALLRTKAGRKKSTVRQRTEDGIAVAGLEAGVEGASSAAEEEEVVAKMLMTTSADGADGAEGGAGRGKRGSKKSNKLKDEAQQQAAAVAEEPQQQPAKRTRGRPKKIVVR
jgi:hypothetical protein